MANLNNKRARSRKCVFPFTFRALQSVLWYVGLMNVRERAKRTHSQGHREALSRIIEAQSQTLGQPCPFMRTRQLELDNGYAPNDILPR
jgi:hypothetical protein